MRNKTLFQKITAAWLLATMIAATPLAVQSAYADQTVSTTGQKITLSMTEDGDKKTLGINNTDTKTSIGTLTWTDTNTTYDLTGDTQAGTITLAGSDNTEDTVSIGYSPDDINRRITGLSTSMTNIENNVTTILAQATGTAVQDDVVDGKTFNSSAGLGLVGTRTAMISDDILMTQHMVPDRGFVQIHVNRNNIKRYLDAEISSTIELPTATRTAAGLMSAADKSKLDEYTISEFNENGTETLLISKNS